MQSHCLGSTFCIPKPQIIHNHLMTLDHIFVIHLLRTFQIKFFYNGCINIVKQPDNKFIVSRIGDSIVEPAVIFYNFIIRQIFALNFFTVIVHILKFLIRCFHCCFVQYCSIATVVLLIIYCMMSNVNIIILSSQMCFSFQLHKHIFSFCKYDMIIRNSKGLFHAKRVPEKINLRTPFFQNRVIMNQFLRFLFSFASFPNSSTLSITFCVNLTLDSEDAPAVFFTQQTFEYFNNSSEPIPATESLRT